VVYPFAGSKGGESKDLWGGKESQKEIRYSLEYRGKKGNEHRASPRRLWWREEGVPQPAERVREKKKGGKADFLSPLLNKKRLS